MNIEIYTSPTCGYCHQAKQFLHERGVHFVEYDVAQDRQAAQRMVQLTGQMGVPVVVIDGEAIIGFNRPFIERLLSEKGSCERKPVKFGVKIADAARYAHQEGAYLGSVESGSPAERAGLKLGDTIVSLDAVRILTAVGMEQYMRSLQAGSNVMVVFIRNGKSMQTHLVV